MTTRRRSSSERVVTGAGRQYHLDVGPGDVAETVILCGEPERAARLATRFERVEVERRQREFVTITGRRGGQRLTVCATGIGADNTEIAVVELCQVTSAPTLIRAGSCGAIQDHLRLGDLVISSAALRLEATSLAYVPEGYPAAAHPEVVMALIAACARAKLPHHVGLTATAAGFYGAQGRHIPRFPPRRAAIVDELRTLGVLNFEMEASALFTLASLRGLRAGAVCAVYAQRREGELATDAERAAAEARCIDAALGAVEILGAMDRARRTRPHWHPGLGLAPRKAKK